MLEVKVGREIIPVSLVRSCNTIAEARPEQDPLEATVCTIQEGLTQLSLGDVATHFTQEPDPDSQSKLDGEEPPQPFLPEPKPLPPGLKYAFLHNNRATPVVISDNLTESDSVARCSLGEVPISHQVLSAGLEGDQPQPLHPSHPYGTGP